MRRCGEGFTVIDALAYQYGKTLFIRNVYLEMEGVRKSQILELGKTVVKLGLVEENEVRCMGS
jgi:hypothetical protein